MKKLTAALIAILMLIMVVSPAMGLAAAKKTTQKPVDAVLSATYSDENGAREISVTATAKRKGALGPVAVTINGVDVEGKVTTKVVKHGSTKYYQSTVIYQVPNDSATELDVRYEISMKNGSTQYTGVDAAKVSLSSVASGSRFNFSRNERSQSKYSVGAALSVDRQSGYVFDKFSFVGTAKTNIPTVVGAVKHSLTIKQLTTDGGETKETTIDPVHTYVVPNLVADPTGATVSREYTYERDVTFDKPGKYALYYSVDIKDMFGEVHAKEASRVIVTVEDYNVSTDIGQVVGNFKDGYTITAKSPSNLSTINGANVTHTWKVNGSVISAANYTAESLPDGYTSTLNFAPKRQGTYEIVYRVSVSLHGATYRAEKTISINTRK